MAFLIYKKAIRGKPYGFFYERSLRKKGVERKWPSQRRLRMP
jgi:hypothetical protein